MCIGKKIQTLKPRILGNIGHCARVDFHSIAVLHDRTTIFLLLLRFREDALQFPLCLFQVVIPTGASLLHQFRKFP
jgi:hypothetical protein